MMKSQFDTYSVKSVMVLGAARGNGLRHIDKNTFENVYGVDINRNYLRECEKRYPELQEVLKTVCVDLTKDVSGLPNGKKLVRLKREPKRPEYPKQDSGFAFTRISSGKERDTSMDIALEK